MERNPLAVVMAVVLMGLMFVFVTLALCLVGHFLAALYLLVDEGWQYLRHKNERVEARERLHHV